MSVKTTINTETIPQEMRARPQWVCWRFEERDGKTTKVPIDAKSGYLASTTNPHTWSSFDRALSTFTDGEKCHGIGFVFNDDFVGIDLDHAVDPSGRVKSWAQAILESCPTYQELSPSGTGVHLIVRGKLPGRGHNQRHYADGAVEIYVGTHLVPRIFERTPV